MTDQHKRLEILQAEVHYEGELYWQRFMSFATLHAGTFVIATSTGVQNRFAANLIITLLGLLLAALWIAVQFLSLRYVDSAKDAYRKEGGDLQIKRNLPPFLSSTDLGAWVPVIVAVAWAVLLWIVLT